uniref:Inner membrane protein YjdF n=1 Tax=Candidatus Methanophagaceae archaeon ANME-1 ERB6 TaxID=2759912 RepID=A0A7G9Z0U9_9EURY|nr:integral membrane protein [uncultured archaeon GZfos12E1]QNO53883.1 hypothetical protein LBDBNMAG_00018 [Methanosarcinales archaeon ANME-1 ERB6]
MLREKIGIYLAYLMQMLIVVYAVYSVYTRDYFWAIWGFFALILTLTPLMLKRRFHVTLPWELNFLIVLSLYLSVSGNVQGWYYHFYPFYDKVAHLVSSITIAVLGFVAAVIMDRYTEIKMNRPLIVIFVIIFTMAIGSFWEITEFVSDNLFGTQLQVGLRDTMYDLIFDLAGGTIIGVLGDVYLKRMPKERFFSDFLN